MQVVSVNQHDYSDSHVQLRQVKPGEQLNKINELTSNLWLSIPWYRGEDLPKLKCNLLSWDKVAGDQMKLCTLLKWQETKRYIPPAKFLLSLERRVENHKDYQCRSKID